MKKIACMICTFVMICSLLPVVASASEPSFKDVPSDYWAAKEIETLSTGGLIHGYSGGYYGPKDVFTVDQMATIICNAKGIATGEKNGYWAYDAMDTCINKLFCVPKSYKHMEITRENFGIPCTREVAIYMLMEALYEPENGVDYSITSESIPDYGDIDSELRMTILKAYQVGITNGYYTDRTFLPKNTLSRAQAAAIFFRAGYTKADEKAVVVPEKEQGEILTNKELYAKIKDMGIWDEDVLDNGHILSGNNSTYGGIEVGYYVNEGFPDMLTIDLYEKEDRFTWVDGHRVDLNGKKIGSYTAPYDANGKYMCTSGYSYKARLKYLDLLKLIFPNDYNEIYGATKQVFNQGIYEGSDRYPNFIRWADNRCITASLCDEGKCFQVEIQEKNDKDVYNSIASEKRDGCTLKYGYGINYNCTTPAKAFELNKW